jgi:hypothetical protein
MGETRKPVLTGGCQCGAVRYAVYAMPERAGICHCRMCQKAVGGPFMAWAGVPAKDFAWTRGTPASFQSSSAAERVFCARCGTPLGFRYTQRPESLDVTVGSLDQPARVRLSVTLESAQRWPSLDGKMTEQRIGEGGSADALSGMQNFQHPDHDTPADWRVA